MGLVKMSFDAKRQRLLASHRRKNQEVGREGFRAVNENQLIEPGGNNFQIQDVAALLSTAQKLT